MLVISNGARKLKSCSLICLKVYPVLPTCMSCQFLADRNLSASLCCQFNEAYIADLREPPWITLAPIALIISILGIGPEASPPEPVKGLPDPRYVE